MAADAIFALFIIVAATSIVWGAFRAARDKIRSSREQRDRFKADLKAALESEDPRRLEDLMFLHCRTMSDESRAYVEARREELVRKLLGKKP